MAYGARFRTPTGTVQIDETYVNHMFRSKGSLTTNSDGYGYVDITCESPILAFRSVAMAGIIRMQQISPTVRRYWFVTMRPTTSIDRYSAVVEWWMFDRAKYGELFDLQYTLRIRNPFTKETIFDSRGKYLRIEHTLTGRASAVIGDGGDTLFANGVNFNGQAPLCAVIQGAPLSNFEAVTISVGTNIQYMLLWGTSLVRATGGNTFYGRSHAWQQSGPHVSGVNYGPTYKRYYYSYMVVDVTDF